MRRPPTAASGHCAVEPSRIALSVAGRSNTAASVAAARSDRRCRLDGVDRRHVGHLPQRQHDAGATFGAPVRVNDIDGDPRASGEQAARVVVGHGNAIHVVWPAKRDGHSVIRYAGSKDGGRTFSPAVTVAGATLTGARGWHVRSRSDTTAACTWSGWTAGTPRR